MIVVTVLLLPVALLLAACLLDRLERRVVPTPSDPRTPIPRPAAPDEAPVADVVPLRDAHVVPLRPGQGLDSPTLRLRKAS